MKKLFLIATMFMFCFLLKGQNIKSDSTKISYCEIVGRQKVFSEGITIQIDNGQTPEYEIEKRYKNPATGKPYVFNTMIDALNFMAKDGWELVQAYAVTEGQSNVYHYLLKRSTPVKKN